MGQHIKQLETPHYCQYCGAELKRKRIPCGDLETFTSFAKRKFCNSRCFGNYRLTHNKDNQTNRNAHCTAQKINEEILKISCCQICGAETKLDVHHKDGNYNNNSLDNLLVLCRSCHMKIHNPKGTCYICGDEQKGLGLCNKHYIRYKKFNCPLYYGYNKKCKECLKTKEDIDLCLTWQLEN